MAQGPTSHSGTLRTVQNVSFFLPSEWESVKGSGTKSFRSEEFSKKGTTMSLIADVSVREADSNSNEKCVEDVVSFAGGLWTSKSTSDSIIARQTELDGKGNIKRVSYVGCSVKAKWSLVFLSNAPGKMLKPVAQSVVDSLRYIDK